MDDEEYAEIQAVAESARLTVSAWVRSVLREARTQRSNRKDDAPVPDGAGPNRSAPANREPCLPDADPRWVQAVMDRHGFTSGDRAVLYALRRAAGTLPAASRIAKLRGSGWSGELEALRPGGAHGGATEEPAAKDETHR